jgi:Uma2 family endonuclease
MPVSAETYKRVVLEDTDRIWELVCGRLREKPPMTTEHEQHGRTLGALLIRQVDLSSCTVGINSGRLRTSTGSYYVPDVVVIPMPYVRRLLERPGTFEAYDEPMPLVVEIWSPSTGSYDVDEKLAEYRQRGDQGIRRIHPYERTLIAWRRRPDGTYAETLYREGTIQPIALPGVTVDLAALFQ